MTMYVDLFKVDGARPWFLRKVAIGDYNVGDNLVIDDADVANPGNIFVILADGRELELCEKILGRKIPFRGFTFHGPDAVSILLNFNQRPLTADEQID